MHSSGLPQDSSTDDAARRIAGNDLFRLHQREMWANFLWTEVACTFLGPDADGIAKIEELVAVGFRSRPSGLRSQNIGQFILLVEQQIAQTIE